MKKIILIVALMLLGCGGDTTTTHIAQVDDNGTVLPLYVDDVNVSDIIHMIDIDTLAVTDNGIIVICTDGAVCSVTTDDSNGSNNQDNDISNDTNGTNTQG